MDACPLPETLGAYVERRLSPSGTEEAEAHLAACPACRETALHLVRLRASRPAFSWRWIAAAAAVLLAVVLLNRTGRAPAIPAPGVAPEASGTVILLGNASSATLKPGGRMELREGVLHLLAGSLWIEDPGEPCEVRLPGGILETAQARLLVEILPPRKEAAWIREACAVDAPEVRVWVESGSAVLRLESGEKRLCAPASGAAPPWKGEAGWRSVPSLPERVKDGCWALKEDPRVWEAVLRRLDPSASVGVRFRSGGKCWEVPLGRVLLEATDRLRVRVESTSGKVRVRAGAYEIFEAPVGNLGRRLEPIQGEPGLRAWGGEVEVLEARGR